MPTSAEQQTSTKPAWILALLTSALGAAVLFSAFAGINWTIWVVAASGSLIASRIISLGRVERPLIVLCAWATLLAIGFALTANDFLQFLSVLSVAMLLGLATITLGAENWSELSAKLLAAVPFLAPFRVIGASARAASEAPGVVSSPRSRSIIKGAVLSVPLVVVLIALLGNADAVVNLGIDRFVAWLPDWSFTGRVAFFLFLLALTLGANALAARQMSANFPRYPIVTNRFTLGVTEQRMVLWSAAVVLWLFVLLQLSYFVHPPPAVLGNGVSFAEFARKGFAQLSVAVTIVGAIILVLEYARPSTIDAAERMGLRRLEIALVIALELVLISAFRRVILYEGGYGFTEARVFAQAYMVVIGLSLIALAWELRNGAISVALGRRIAEIALGVFTVLLFWNYEAWIVNRNVDRVVASGRFDPQYLSRLSQDATPTLVRRVSEIPEPERDRLLVRLACRKMPAPRRWFEWNRGVAAASAALSNWQRPPCMPAPPPAQPVPTPRSD
ncbi:MAG: DUF4153 domain-containing protein [Gemmatimonadaceae bacterium]